MSVNDVQASLAALRARFLDRARDEVRFLLRQADKMREQGLSVAELSEAYQLLHRLAGSAGTFGLPELGETARRLEKTLKPHVEQLRVNGVPDDDQGPAVPAFSNGVRELSELIRPPSSGRGETSQGQHQGQEPGASDPGLQLRVLVCHSSARRSQELIRGLTPYGFQCEEVPQESPRLAEIVGAARETPSLVLVSEDRLESVAGECRRLGLSGRELPLVCLAAGDAFEKRYRAASAGAECYFSEPLDMAQLADSIERLFSVRKQLSSGRVLLVEDDPELAEHYQLILSSAGVAVRLVREPGALMAELAEFQPDIVLLDVELDGLSGVTLARLIRFEPAWLSLPIIYLSSEDDPDNQLAAVSKGADEFLTKPVTDGFLVRTVLHRCQRARQLSELMNRDSLTGLLKHSVIKQEVQRELSSCERLGHKSSIAMLDLDHFKHINDTWGHGCGDRVIKALANLLRNRLRESDLLGRYGGEEFLVVLPGCDAGQARSLMENISRSFAELSFVGNGDGSFNATLSAGIACLNDFYQGDQALEAADQALYQQKRAGRNGVSVYAPQTGNAWNGGRP